MINFPIQFRPEDAIKEFAELNRKLLEGLDSMSRMRELDIQVGASPKEEVFREDKLRLYRFQPLVSKPFPIPIVIVYALVNRPYMVDLQEDRSLVRNLLELGMEVYLIDWGYPGREDRWLTLDDYINDYIDSCVESVLQRHGIPAVNLLGICQGGTFSLCYAALHPQKINKLITMVTPVDFHVRDGLLNRWVGCTPDGRNINVDLLVDGMGNIPGEFMNAGYLMLQPFLLGVQKYIDLVDVLDDEAKLTNFLRMEKWIFDSPDQAGEAFRQFMKDFYQENKLIKGEVEIGGKRVNLGNIKAPVLNIYAELDHLVPPASSVALEKYVGSRNYGECSFPVGHIGMYVSSKVQSNLPPTIAQWIKDTKMKGRNELSDQGL